MVVGSMYRSGRQVSQHVDGHDNKAPARGPVQIAVLQRRISFHRGMDSSLVAMPIDQGQGFTACGAMPAHRASAATYPAGRYAPPDADIPCPLIARLTPQCRLIVTPSPDHVQHGPLYLFVLPFSATERRCGEIPGYNSRRVTLATGGGGVLRRQWIRGNQGTWRTPPPEP